MESFPDALHIFTYDVRGTLSATGHAKQVRETGLVTHTHQLLHGLARHHPHTRLAVTQSGAAAAGPVAELVTPEGLAVELRSIATRFPKYLCDPRGGKSRHLVQRYYEDEIADPGNPVWLSLAHQYARTIGETGIPDLLLQNINPIVSVLKAEEFGLLDADMVAALGVTAVVHDGADSARRFGYLAQRLAVTRARLSLIAVSDSVRKELISAGVPAGAVRTVLNGMDAASFEDRMRQARNTDVFAKIRERNQLPPGRIVLVSARRVPWKGQQDVIHAAHSLHRRGRMQGAIVVINGAGLLDTRSPGYQDELERLIADLGLSRTVFLLDRLSPPEVAACYTAAHIAAHPSRDPEPFGYSNLEAMIAEVPVIAAGHGGPLEYITDGESGLLVPPGDPDTLAAAIDALLSDDALHARLAAAGRASAERFTLDAMFSGYRDVITAGTGARPVEAGAR